MSLLDAIKAMTLGCVLLAVVIGVLFASADFVTLKTGSEAWGFVTLLVELFILGTLLLWKTGDQ